jgi:hypothetical protein
MSTGERMRKKYCWRKEDGDGDGDRLLLLLRWKRRGRSERNVASQAYRRTRSERAEAGGIRVGMRGM